MLALGATHLRLLGVHCGIWRGEVQKVGVICDSTRSNEELASSDIPDIRQEVSAPGHSILLVSVLLCSTGLTDPHQNFMSGAR